MGISPEARARGVFAEAKEKNYSKEGLRELVALAIRQAEQDAVTMSEIKIAALHRLYQDMLAGRASFAVHGDAAAVRSLKSKET